MRHSVAAVRHSIARRAIELQSRAGASQRHRRVGRRHRTERGAAAATAEAGLFVLRRRDLMGVEVDAEAPIHTSRRHVGVHHRVDAQGAAACWQHERQRIRDHQFERRSWVERGAIRAREDQSRARQHHRGAWACVVRKGGRRGGRSARRHRQRHVEFRGKTVDCATHLRGVATVCVSVDRHAARQVGVQELEAGIRAPEREAGEARAFEARAIRGRNGLALGEQRRIQSTEDGGDNRGELEQDSANRVRHSWVLLARRHGATPPVESGPRSCSEILRSWLLLGPRPSLSSSPLNFVLLRRDETPAQKAC